MNKQQAIQALSNNKTVLTQRFGVTRLATFGSTARDVATASSDTDILVAKLGWALEPTYGKYCNIHLRGRQVIQLTNIHYSFIKNTMYNTIKRIIKGANDATINR